MFGFRGGEPQETVERKKGYRVAAREKWPFLTHFDLSTLKNPAQLSSMVKDRSGMSHAEADVAVQDWMQGKHL